MAFCRPESRRPKASSILARSSGTTRSSIPWPISSAGARPRISPARRLAKVSLPSSTMKMAAMFCSSMPRKRSSLSRRRACASRWSSRTLSSAPRARSASCTWRRSCASVRFLSVMSWTNTNISTPSRRYEVATTSTSIGAPSLRFHRHSKRARPSEVTLAKQLAKDSWLIPACTSVRVEAQELVAAVAGERAHGVVHLEEGARAPHGGVAVEGRVDGGDVALARRLDGGERLVRRADGYAVHGRGNGRTVVHATFSSASACAARPGLRARIARRLAQAKAKLVHLGLEAEQAVLAVERGLVPAPQLGELAVDLQLGALALGDVHEGGHEMLAFRAVDRDQEPAVQALDVRLERLRHARGHHALARREERRIRVAKVEDGLARAPALGAHEARACARRPRSPAGR